MELSGDFTDYLKNNRTRFIDELVDFLKIPSISSLPELLSYAHAIEVDAEERYRMLADQMEVHNNQELAKLFRELAGHEEKHAAEIEKHAEEIGIERLKPVAFDWPDLESPEAAELDASHYLMTPWPN